MQLCRFCREVPNEATTTIHNQAYSKGPLPACQDCRDEWDQQCYDDYRAEQAYEEYERTGELASIDHVRLLKGQNELQYLP